MSKRKKDGNSPGAYEKHTVTIPTKWMEPVMLPRKRLPRKRTVEGRVTYSVPILTKEAAPLAFVIHDRSFIRTTNNPDERTEYGDVTTKLFSWENKLWTPIMESDKHCHGRTEVPWGIESLEEEMAAKSLRTRFNLHYPKDGDLPFRDLEQLKKEGKESKRKYIRNLAAEYAIIDGLVCRPSGEPMYVVVTFGLGHNHGGTGAFIETFYNSNIAKENYFRADERERCIEYADEVAAGRGDTDDVGHFLENKSIEVIMPEVIKNNPKLDHGDGDPTINLLESFITSSSSANEAALGVMAIGLGLLP